MKELRISYLSCLFLFIALSIAVAQPKGKEIVIGQSFSLSSKILNEERPYQVYLPNDYQPNGNPLTVMYLMDGDFHFHHTSGIVSFLKSQGRIPNMMIVAIPNTTDRTRDLTPPIEKNKEAVQNMPTAGGANNMLAFMKEELIPHIDKQYNTNDYRMLVGHSFGGIFAVQALLTQGDLYDSYIAISPSMWWDDQSLVDRAKKFLDSEPAFDGYFYMTMGNEDGPMLGGAMKLAALFEEKRPKTFGWDFKVMKEETHGSVPHRSTYYGLEAVFKDWYNVDLGKLYVEEGMSGIDKHYTMLSTKLGFDMKPSEGDINVLGYELMQGGELDKAIEIFQDNVKQYPGSYNTYDSLAEALLANKDKKSAIKNYKKSVEIHPGNANAVNVLKTLEVDFNPIAKPLKLSEKEMATYVGKFSVSTGGTINVKVENGQLIVWSDDTGMPEQTLLPVYKNAFVIQPSNGLLLFGMDKKNKAKSFEAQMGPGRSIKGELLDSSMSKKK